MVELLASSVLCLLHLTEHDCACLSSQRKYSFVLRNRWLPRQAAVAPAPAFASTQTPGTQLAFPPASTDLADAPAPSSVQPAPTPASSQMQDALKEVRTSMSLLFMIVSCAHMSA